MPFVASILKRLARALLCVVPAVGAARAASLPAAEAGNFMVVSAQRLATEAGVAMLAQGGNAIDAAVAVG